PGTSCVNPCPAPCGARTRTRVRTLRRRLFPVLAKIGDETCGAGGLARLADVASVQDQPVVGVHLELVRRYAHELVLEGAHVRARRDTGPVRDAEDVSVDRDRWLA